MRRQLRVAGSAARRARPVVGGVIALAERFCEVRHATVGLCDPLSPEDLSVQSMPDASPTKWHLAHTSWFFERFVLRAHVPTHKPFDANYDRLFNSYYHSVGEQHPRALRGVLSRPSLAEILRYRAHVNDAVQSLIARGDAPPEALAMVELGIHHEQQHQELVLTDIKHAFSCNPAQPSYQAGPIKRQPPAPPLQWVERPE